MVVWNEKRRGKIRFDGVSQLSCHLVNDAHLKPRLRLATVEIGNGECKSPRLRNRSKSRFSERESDHVGQKMSTNNIGSPHCAASSTSPSQFEIAEADMKVMQTNVNRGVIVGIVCFCTPAGSLARFSLKFGLTFSKHKTFNLQKTPVNLGEVNFSSFFRRRYRKKCAVFSCSPQVRVPFGSKHSRKLGFSLLTNFTALLWKSHNFWSKCRLISPI